MNKDEIIGQVFNRLTVLEFHHKDDHHRKFYKCKCLCGNTKIIQGSFLKSGNTKSCGCLSNEIKSSKKLPNNQGVINHLILQYKRHAKRRNILFDLDRDLFTLIIQQPCYYCGLPPSNNKITKNCSGFLYSGIDRKDSFVGYIEENSVPCCSQCNYAKRALNNKDFISWIERVYNFQPKRLWLINGEDYFYNG